MSSDIDSRLRVVSRSEQPFSDRAEAGRLLARELGDLRGKSPVILGIPRGGVVVAAELANALDGDLDIVLSRKLGTPGQPELAMGSLAEDGAVFLNDDVVRSVGVPRRAIELERDRQVEEIRRRSLLIRRKYPKIPLKGRTVVVSDDGVATGATMQAALWATRHEEPRRLIAAVPVASEEALRRLLDAADEVLCLRQPAYFYAVGQAYYEFSQVEDEEVLRILEAARLRR
jgi:putative phosphoribosyl transferase